MQSLAAAAFILMTVLAAPAFAQDSQKALQSEADKGIKTENSGASGYVGEQNKPGTATQMPGGRTDAGSAATTPSAQNSGAGVTGAPGNKNGPPAGATTGSSTQNPSVLDTSGVKGQPGSKSGPAVKKRCGEG